MSDLTVGSLFSGIGLLDYGLHLAGLRHAWFAEADEWRRGILRRRWPGVPVHDDVRAVGADTVERVDVIAGGFPCKGASTAGKRTGFGHPETVLWREMARAVRGLRPRYVLVENVANLLVLHDGALWGEVVGTLAALRYDTVWDCLPAGAVGAPHLRDRVFCIAADATSVTERAPHHEANPITERRDARQVPGVRGAESAPDTDSHPLRLQPARESRSGRRAIAGRAGEAAADTDGSPRRWQRHADRAVDHDGCRGVEVAWGDYAAAIQRWEAIHGPAPQPLVRRMDDRGAARVERSERRVDRQRLSALGDGVQVQIGWLVGQQIVNFERERLKRAAMA